ncbi:MAG: ribosomal RNA small subunit methyltransferase A [Phycisphaerae bacterium]|jgi:16S rRNA (adenine1518-N6/adenine1519-N6)-dimethyltransferase
MAGQTLSEIRGLLAAAGLRPQHRFGQNFLIDLNLMRKLVAAAEIVPGDVVLEVGAGTGSLTELLLRSGARVVAAEIDRGLSAMLAERLAGAPNITLYTGDALAGKHSIEPQLLAMLSEHAPGPGGARKLVANLPYQIATPLLMELLHVRPPLERMVCTIQREVGERLLAPPRSDAYGPVSVVMSVLARVELLAQLPPEAFWPRPKIDSVMMRIRPLPPGFAGPNDAADFARFVQRAFQHRRKMLRRGLRDAYEGDVETLLASAGVSPESRPEELAAQEWRTLYRLARSSVR